MLILDNLLHKSFFRAFFFSSLFFDYLVLVQDKNDVQHQLSILLFLGLASGFLMLLFTIFFGSWALTGKKDHYMLSVSLCHKK